MSLNNFVELVDLPEPPPGSEAGPVLAEVDFNLASFIGGTLPGEQRLFVAMLARLTHHVHSVEMNGECYGLKSSRENAGPQAPDESDNP